jgi:hypothetical protein
MKIRSAIRELLHGDRQTWWSKQLHFKPLAVDTPEHVPRRHVGTLANCCFRNLCAAPSQTDSETMPSWTSENESIVRSTRQQSNTWPNIGSSGIRSGDPRVQQRSYYEHQIALWKYKNTGPVLTTNFFLAFNRHVVISHTDKYIDHICATDNILKYYLLALSLCDTVVSEIR